MFLAFLTLLTSLVISGVAIYYSVSGLAAIFAAAAIPIIIMGASLEVGKLVTALWLHRNWKTAPFALKTYLMIATVVLMFITSIGIFGFLSRAHIEQTAGIGTVSTQIEQLNLDIRLEQDKIDNNRKIIAQLDTAVNNLLAGSATQSQQTRTGNAQQASNLAAQATRLRQQQNAERTKLQAEITEASNKIAELNRKKLEFDQKIKNIETEVGPIKYIAQFVYGNEAGTNKDLLEKAVTWLILIIIFVFDPLAVLLLIASQISWMEATARWRSRRKKEPAPELTPVVEQSKTETHTEEKKDALDIPNSNINDRDEPEPVIEQPVVNEPAISNNLPSVNTQVTDAVTVVPAKEEDPIEAWNKMVEEAEKAAAEEKIAKEPRLKKKEAYIMKDGNKQILVPKKDN